MTKRLMIDLETLNANLNAVVISIGAVFDTGETFYRVIDIDSCVRLGATVSHSTIKWWMGQDKSVFKEDDDKFVGIAQAIVELENFITSTVPDDKERDKLEVWANGSDFDIGILKFYYLRLQKEVLWKFWNVRDFRTLKNYSSKKYAKLKNSHNALEDAVNQMSMLKEILNEISSKS